MTDIFEEDYLLQLFKLALKDIKHLDQLIPHMKYAYMPSEEYKSLWKKITTEYTLGTKVVPPTIGLLIMAFRKDSKVLELLAQLKQMDVVDEERVLAQLQDFLKQHMFLEIYEEIYTTYTKQSFNGESSREKAFEIFTTKAEEFSNFSLATNKLETVFGGFQNRVVQRTLDSINNESRRLPTPFEGINHYTNGGGERGELWCYLGQSGSGKSFNLDQHAVELARRGEKVLLIKAEGTKRQNMDRLDSNWTGTLYYDIKDNNLDDKKLQRCYKVVEDISEGEIFVEVFEKFDSRTARDVRNTAIELKRKHPELSTIIVDYFELIDPGDGKKYSTDPSGEKSRQQALGRLFKNIAVELDVWFITATQAAEGSIDPEKLNDPNFVMRRANLGADKDKVRPMDVFITQNRTKDEIKKKLARLHIDKAREHAGGQTIYICQNLAKSKYYDRVATLKKFGGNVTADWSKDDDEK
jgi:hypothetical protein